MLGFGPVCVKSWEDQMKHKLFHLKWHKGTHLGKGKGYWNANVKE